MTSGSNDEGFALPGSGNTANVTGSFSPGGWTSVIYTSESSRALGTSCGSKKGVKKLTLSGTIMIPAGSPIRDTVAYVTNYNSNNVSVIDTATNTVTAAVGEEPNGVAITPDGSTVYVANSSSGTVSVISTATDTVTGTVGVGASPEEVAITPDGSKAYVTNGSEVSVIDIASNTVTATVPVGNRTEGVAITPDGSKAYVVDYESVDVSVVDTEVIPR